MADLERFVTAQKRDYAVALQEMRQGRKRSHWIWYIFPQLDGLGFSSTAQYYGIRGLAEAEAYLHDPYLSAHLVEISEALLANPSDDPSYVMGYPDDLKLRSSMTLFDAAAAHLGRSAEFAVFAQVLDKFYHGQKDGNTLRLL